MKTIICHYCEKQDDLKNPNIVLDSHRGIYYHALCLPEDAGLFRKLATIIKVNINKTRDERLDKNDL